MKLFSNKVCDSRGREYYFDNAKFILILLVVIAHFCSPLKSNHPKVDAMWLIINTMHMPCLIFISGYFAKTYIKPDGTVKLQRLFSYVVYYIAAQISVSLFEYFVLGYVNMEKSLFAARSSLWFLQCLIVWYLVLPYVSKLNKKIVIVSSFVAGILIGYDTAIGGFLSVSRIFVHFPFFILGYYIDKEWFVKYRNKLTQSLSIVIWVVSYIIMFIYQNDIPKRIITSSHNYYDAALQFGGGLGWLYRIGFYISAIILSVTFMLLVPRVKTFFTTFGKRTLQVYIIHRFIYLAELEYEWWLPFDSAKGCILMAAISVVMTFIMSLRIFEYPFEWLGKIKVDLLLEKKK